MPTSVLADSLQSIRKRIEQLEPLVAEHQQLTAALAALEPLQVGHANGAASRPASAAPIAPKTRKSGKSKAKSRTIAPKGERARQMLQVIAENPGISAKEVAELMQITIGNTQFQVRKLLDDGQLRRNRGVLYVTSKATVADAPNTSAPATAPKPKSKTKARPKSKPRAQKSKPVATPVSKIESETPAKSSEPGSEPATSG